MSKLYKCTKCGSVAFILDKPEKNLAHIVNINISEKTKGVKDDLITVYCLECNNPETISEQTIISKYITKTTENYLKEI